MNENENHMIMKLFLFLICLLGFFRLGYKIHSGDGFLNDDDIHERKKNSHHAEALVLACTDFRFIDDYSLFLHKKGLDKKYDEFILAGGSLGYNQKEYPEWGASFREHLDFLTALHGIKKVIAIDHENCGAYKKFYHKTELNGNIEQRLHNENLSKLKESLALLHPELSFEGYFCHLNGTMEIMA